MQKTERRHDINYKILDYIKENQVILSIGCGSGLLESEIKKRANTVYGIDIDPEAVEAARKKIDKAIVANIETMETLPFEKESFDVITFVDVLEHLTNPVKALKLAGQYLKPGGYIVASIPNIANWKVRLDLLLGKFDYENYGTLDKTHVKFYTLLNAKKLLEEGGFKVTSVDCTSNLLNLIYGNFVKKNNVETTRRVVSTVQTAASPPKPKDLSLAPYQVRGKLQRGSKTRSLAKHILEDIDYSLAKNFKGLFAYQFILVGKRI